MKKDREKERGKEGEKGRGERIERSAVTNKIESCGAQTPTWEGSKSRKTKIHKERWSQSNSDKKREPSRCVEVNPCKSQAVL